MRNRFDAQLAELNKELIQMGSMCEEIIALAAKALAEGDCALAAKTVSLDTDIDQMERTIESLCLKLLLQQQPVARDLRQISAALKMITDLERIGDQAADIAEITAFLNGRTAAECNSILSMAQASIKMVDKAADLLCEKDVALAQSAIAHDDVVDDYFIQVKSSLIQMIAEKPEDGEYALDLLMIAKYFERIGDHAANIAEWVVFSVTGSMREKRYENMVRRR